ncbi:MAG: hypothetical protein HWD57_11030 [Candidatus Accumulibacter cognatus]|uniref:Uncharacterized protein n=1 Tax=Candidatus Accumulibacter cognatus TaxID=2954383 RepID=A0A7D5N9Z7_9PROT|nr:MAG: hypothetical protein HWD57_11030 [Candidatus Accumulibacter cognatus]
MPRMIHKPAAQRQRIADLTGFPLSVVEEIIAVHAAMILGDLARWQSAHLPALGRIRVRRGPATRVHQSHLSAGVVTSSETIRPGILRASLKPSKRLSRVLKTLDEVFD